MSFLSSIKDLKIHIYKYVPPCPNCGSLCTGRYVKMPISEKDRDYMERETLKYGEVIRFVPKIPGKNLFCVDCDHKWHGSVETRRYSRKEIDKEVEDRGTYDAYLEIIEEQEEKKKGFFSRKRRDK